MLRRRWTKLLVAAACLLPLALLVAGAFTGTLSANPIDDITDGTGTWTLRFIMITLAITPVRELLGVNALLRFRRMLGLFAFLYGSLHFLTYLWLDQFFDLQSILADIPRRPFITLGFTSFVLMIPLALTSADRIARWMGGQRWRMLHRLVYGTAVGGVIHYLWLVKADIRRPLFYGAVLSLLLGYRLFRALRKKWSARSQAASL
ncbi:MAG: sulfoxide reductase heme-binding subunit YedZ [Proteobacteria bacterium]|nr:sulfoxide reductase heme-binding subunit YedZ [Pseudomonadota bacterium]